MDVVVYVSFAVYLESYVEWDEIKLTLKGILDNVIVPIISYVATNLDMKS